jgi:steroid 5-alpha reductase family enzyme
MLAQAPHLLLTGAAIVFVMMFLLWLLHMLIHNTAVVDVGWAAGLGLLAIYYAAAGPGYPARKYAIATMAGIWSLRLASYLLFARVIGHPEEGRYVELRQSWKSNLPLRFFFFFEFQALLDLVLSLPFLLACLDTRVPLGPLEKIGAAIWLIGMIGEATADAQLNAFKKNPSNKGKTCRAGLWNYSRHPNYFFEWIIWVGYAVFAIASPWDWLGILSPALILYFLLRLTGIPATEVQALRSRGEESPIPTKRATPAIGWRSTSSPAA